MRIAPVALTLALPLAACQGMASAPAASALSVQAGRTVGPNYEVCGSRGFKRLDSNGGVQRVPHIANQNQFMGEFGYAAINGGGTVQGLVFSCPTSDPIAPIPRGYTPDWFGSWTLYCSTDDDVCADVSFGNGNLKGHIISDAWVASRTYYLYLYSDDTRQYIESYKIGPVNATKDGSSRITSESPFENGLTYPQNDGYSLEIVHPSTQ